MARSGVMSALQSDALIVGAIGQALVEAAGGVENAARLLALAAGIVPDPASNRDDLASRKGTISKRLSGQLDWPAVDLLALERAVRLPLFSHWTARAASAVVSGATLASTARDAAREAGEAMAAVFDHLATGGDLGAVRKEVREAQQAIGALAAFVDGAEVP